MNSPFARASPSSSLPQSRFQFPPSNFNFTSLFFIPSKPSHFVISAATNQSSPSPPPAHAQSINRSLIPVQEAKNRSKKIQDLAERFKDGNFETITQFNHLFMGLVLENEVDLAYKFYSTLSSYDFSADSFTFSILVHCYCKRNEPMEAKRVLEHMIQNGFESPKVKTFTQLINSFCKRGKLKQAFEVFEIMGKVKCDPTINTYNCLLKGLCYVGKVEEAYELLTKIKKSWNLQPDVYSFTAVMDGFCKVGRSNEALELLNEAIEMGLKPSIVTYNTIFNGYFKEGRPKDGFGLLKQMKERNCNPDYISYSTLLHGLLQWGEIGDGLRVYNQMLDMGFDIDGRMMNTLLRGICRRSRKEKELLKDAYQLFDEMSKRGVDIDPCAHELMIEAFCNGNEMDKAFMNLCEMIKMNLSPKTFTLNSVVRGLCVEGKIEKALLVLVLVCRGRRGMLDGVTFDVLIDEMNRQGMFKLATCVYCVALKNRVNLLRKPV
ncbi:pentatricopeptide repeat-containing protein At1g62680, mitochondrial-like [Cynara cardunculus var. scolymus]|nr:pentatricopeptide repeat-containing protein At1g62680, mitochondrial-like [Cynara cardunculus var. scolymus]